MIRKVIFCLLLLAGILFANMMLYGETNTPQTYNTPSWLEEETIQKTTASDSTLKEEEKSRPTPKRTFGKPKITARVLNVGETNSKNSLGYDIQIVNSGNTATDWVTVKLKIEDSVGNIYDTQTVRFDQRLGPGRSAVKHMSWKIDVWDQARTVKEIWSGKVDENYFWDIKITNVNYGGK